MKAPPLLLGAGLLFWGWQAGHPLAGAVMALALEGARLTRTRWEFSDQDFARIWTFCSVLLLGAVAYAFTANRGPAGFSSFFQNPNPVTQRDASTASLRTGAAVISWLPIIFFLFLAAQAYSERESIPLEVISLILRRRWKKARRLGRPVPANPTFNVTYPYFALCLLGASVHAAEQSNSYFWGLCPLLAWALWPLRARRFSPPAWTAMLVAAVGLAWFAQRGLTQVQRYIGGISFQWFSSSSRRGFDPDQSQTSLGQLGRLKTSARIVIRLEKLIGPVPPLLREASYRTYRRHTWYSDATEKDFQQVASETDETTHVLLPGKTNTAALGIACYLDGGKGLLPLPSGSGRLENLTTFMPLEKSPMGAVIAQGPDLVLFDAYYGPGATIDASAGTNEDLSVPPREAPALEQVVNDLHLKGHDLDWTLRKLNAFFQDNFQYSTWQRPQWRSHSWTNGTPLSRFLLQTRRGHCEYFATAAVLLLRQAGFPARYAVGYAVHEGNGRNFVVRQRDAHAWCLVWNHAAATWLDFDPTPASWLQIEAGRASALQSLSDFWSWLGFEFAKFRWGQGQLRQYILWALAPILALLLYQILFRRRARRRSSGPGRAGRQAAWPGLDSEFYQLEQKLNGRGLPRRPSEPLSAWLQRALAEPALAGLRKPVAGLLRLHYRYRFDPQGLSPAEREALRRQARACLTAIKLPSKRAAGVIQNR